MTEFFRAWHAPRPACYRHSTATVEGTKVEGVAGLQRGRAAFGFAALARLVSWRTRRSEMITRRARTDLLVERDSMTARVWFQSRHTAVATAAAAAVRCAASIGYFSGAGRAQNGELGRKGARRLSAAAAAATPAAANDEKIAGPKIEK